MNIWIEKYGFSEQGASKIDQNIEEFNKILKTINPQECVKDNHECEEIKKDLESYR
ncbi:hypothetical protein BSPLISOX_3115 [uncultured Gammaproteobacteria bacterium]|jgi:hypothetical protein|nr:hypothetical protein [uncultured Gammaproteobacteria bacterium]VVH65233.1 hypothetical protein BSPLISOX_3115 [uncultured Gammaproteobacteria bacterium]